ncbi:MAG: hypothetical protein WBL58_00405 [Peptococcia bacterium]|jgi:hypothetical protein
MYKKKCKILKLVPLHFLLCAITIVCSSCMGTHLIQSRDWIPGIAIYELPSYKRIAYISYPGGIIAHINELEKTIYTVSASKNKATIHLISFNGDIISEHDLPIKDYRQIGFQYAVSPDGRFIVFRNYDEETLYKMDLSSLEITLLDDHFCPQGKITHWIKLISPTKIVSEQQEHPSNSLYESKSVSYIKELVITDLQKDTTKTIISTECKFLANYWNTCAWSTCELSPSCRYLVYYLSGTSCGNCRKTFVIDTNTLEIIHVVDHYFTWSPDEEYIIYLRDDSKVVIDKLEAPNPRVLYEMSPGMSKELSCEFLDNEHISIYILRQFPFSYRLLRVMNVNNGELKTFFRVPYVRYDKQVIEGGKKLIGVVGPDLRTGG